VQMRAEIARLQNRLGATTVYVTHDQTEAMTLGDRVVVLRAGEAQQIGTPEELYNTPANLFVAGFIGSPAMNFFPAAPIPGGLRLPFGQIGLDPSYGEQLPADVIVGVRPEHFEDATLLEPHERARALTFGIRADLVESLGADKYVYFSAGGGSAQSAHLSELAADSGIGENRYVARVSADSRAATGQTVELALNAAKVHVFDAASGVNLSAQLG